jgi:hypothetical protein
MLPRTLILMILTAGGRRRDTGQFSLAAGKEPAPDKWVAPRHIFDPADISLQVDNFLFKIAASLFGRWWNFPYAQQTFAADLFAAKLWSAPRAAGSVGKAWTKKKKT